MSRTLWRALQVVEFRTSKAVESELDAKRIILSRFNRFDHAHISVRTESGETEKTNFCRRSFVKVNRKIVFAESILESRNGLLRPIGW